MTIEREAMTLTPEYFLELARRARILNHETFTTAFEAIAEHLSRAAEPLTCKSCQGTGKLLSIGGGYRIEDCPDCANSPEPARDAKDAARYRWLRDHGVPELCIAVDGLPSYIDHRYAVCQLVDAAMAQESGDE